jgi:hypothetical protein
MSMKCHSTRLLTLGVLLVLVTGCGTIEPWVQPYERDRLADPIMSSERDPISAGYLQKLYDIREGARGATGGSGGGCGCN